MGSRELEMLEDLLEWYYEEGLTDGFPVFPPTQRRVASLVNASGFGPDVSLGEMPPSYREVRISDVAVYAAMAGCRPEYMPVVTAAVEVMLEPSFGLHHMATSTIGNAPLIVVNGQIRTEIGLNCRGNVFGPGCRANATIGRAVRLLMIILGGAVPGKTDFATFGHGGKYAYVVGEDEEHSPWAPFHVSDGMDPTSSAVTVMGAGPPRRVGAYVTKKTYDRFLVRLADALSSLGDFGVTGKSETIIFIGPEHRTALSEAGLSKQDVSEYVYEHAGRYAGELEAARTPDDPRSRASLIGGAEGRQQGDWIPVFSSPHDVHVVAAGGEGGNGSMFCIGQPGLSWGRHGRRPVRSAREGSRATEATFRAREP